MVYTVVSHFVGTPVKVKSNLPSCSKIAIKQHFDFHNDSTIGV
jgi:hypothetical protein